MYPLARGVTLVKKTLRRLKLRNIESKVKFNQIKLGFQNDVDITLIEY